MASPVVVRCPSCSQKYRLSPSAIGRKARCKRCHSIFVIRSEHPIDDDTVVGWITDDDPGSQSVMGSTGIFQGPEAPLPSRQEAEEWEEPPPAPVEAQPERAVRLKKIQPDGALFEFPASALGSQKLRNSFPRKCLGCGIRTGLKVHLIYWPERMVPHDQPHLRDRIEASVGALDAYEEPMDVTLLDQLPRTRHIADLFSQPFPFFMCDYCGALREIEAHVLSRRGQEVCRLRIASLAAAVSFFRNNGGRESAAYERLIEARDRQHDAWRELDPRIRHRITQWFTPDGNEQFMRYFRDTGFSPTEAGSAGVVLTDHRLVYKKYTILRDYPLHRPARLAFVKKGDHAIVHVYDEGSRPAIVNLDWVDADALTATLERLQCRWSIGK